MTNLKSWNTYYILDGHTPVPAKDVMEWGRWFESNKRHVKDDIVAVVSQSSDGGKITLRGNGVRVSTVFLGIDHSFGDGPPLIFETMIFGGPHDGWQERCSTWEEAEAMHERALAVAQDQSPRHTISP